MGTGPEFPIQSIFPHVPMTEDLRVGDRVRLIALPNYVKTAEPMPMLRPPNVVTLGEEGTVLNRQPGDTWSIRFEQGAYLLDRQYLEKIS
jgi:hypothetical protein